MKRIRAAGVMPNVPVRVRCVGIDVDCQMLVAAFLDVQATSIPVREFRNDPQGIRALCAACIEWSPNVVGLESTGQYSLSAYDALCNAGLFAVCINPSSLTGLLRADHKGDRADAVTLARLLAHHQRLSWSNMPDQSQRHLRIHFKMMDEALDRLHRYNARLSAVLRSCGLDADLLGSIHSDRRWERISGLGTLPAEEILSGLRTVRRQALASMLETPLPPYALAYRDEAMVLISEAREVIERERQWIDNEAGNEPIASQIAWMLTCPCTSRMIAVRVVAEFGGNFTDRYHDCRAFCSAAGVAPTQEITGGRVVKLGDNPGRPAFLSQFVTSLKGYMLHLPPEMEAWVRAYQARGAGYAKTLLAVAHQTARNWYNCTKLQRPYDPVQAFKNRLPTWTDPTTGEVRL